MPDDEDHDEIRTQIAAARDAIASAKRRAYWGTVHPDPAVRYDQLRAQGYTPAEAVDTLVAERRQSTR